MRPKWFEKLQVVLKLTRQFQHDLAIVCSVTDNRVSRWCKGTFGFATQFCIALSYADVLRCATLYSTEAAPTQSARVMSEAIAERLVETGCCIATPRTLAKHIETYLRGIDDQPKRLRAAFVRAINRGIIKEPAGSKFMSEALSAL